ncbi:hypothetical protein [Rhizobium sp. C1]|uniref:hypothetical protein n=1 Tax=Rhizobium sp. C1 TaxID=1349799 RepID=UPI001E291ED7|nr:hypothetical protein [Rhizobium sp. C1]MCD2179384.1 hypothetical protein [Rhizobium sp. C1]
MAEKDQYDGSTEVAAAPFRTPKSGALNVAVIFGVAAVALTLILAPVIERKSARLAGTVAPGAYDEIVTGSISTNSGPKRYIVRRSVLQDTPGAVCIINSDGSTSGC